MSRTSPQLIVFSYHKSGTSLLLHVMKKVTKRLGLTLVNLFGLVDQLDPEPDVVLLPHSLLRAPPAWPYRAIRMIRDPRDIWVSGYLYHRHCNEEWCTSTDMDPTPPIAWPRVDHSFVHWPEERKRGYLERLGGRSYQQHLLGLTEAEGLDFELDGYTGHTLVSMREWASNGAEALDVKLEDVMGDYDGAMRRIFEHFGFTAVQTEAALEVARSEDVRRMDDAAIAARPQIHSRTISRWRDVLSPAQIGRFEARYGDVVQALGYELTGLGPELPEAMSAGDWFTQEGGPLSVGYDQINLVWPRLAAARDGIGAADTETATRLPDVRLSVDGTILRPTVRGDGLYSFVVPDGAERLQLLSDRDVSADPSAPYLGTGRNVGVQVREIVIRSRGGEVVIPADDPRLTAGWHEAEQRGLVLWRWTDGSAEVPWTGVVGPAVVTVRCGVAELARARGILQAYVAGG